MVFYDAFDSISVISRRQLTLFMSFLGFTSTRLGLRSVLPKDTPTKKPKRSSAARTQDPWITSQTLHHWAMQGPQSRKNHKQLQLQSWFSLICNEKACKKSDCTFQADLIFI